MPSSSPTRRRPTSACSPPRSPGRTDRPHREASRMAATKRPRKASPRTPSRVKKRTTKRKKARSHAHHHPELIGLGLGALGIFLAAVLWFGFSGGPVADLVRG